MRRAVPHTRGGSAADESAFRERNWPAMKIEPGPRAAWACTIPRVNIIGHDTTELLRRDELAARHCANVKLLMHAVRHTTSRIGRSSRVAARASLLGPASFARAEL
jgi:hypothetical protein